MPKRTFELDIPKEATGKQFEREYLQTTQTFLKEQTVLHLYQDGKISTGTGAKMLGMPLYQFLRFLGQHKISGLRTTAKQLDEDVKASKRASKARRRKSTR
jgi:predicted HTH domain antitoxin